MNIANIVIFSIFRQLFAYWHANVRLAYTVELILLIFAIERIFMKRYYQLFFILFVGLLSILAGCSDNRKVLLFLGDSLTAAEGMETNFTFPALVAQKFDGYRAINQGSPGLSTGSFLQIWDEVEDEFPSQVEIVFIQLGGNDLLESGHEDATITSCINNMEMVLTKLRHRFPRAEIVLMSSTKIDQDAMNEQIKKIGYGDRTNLYLSRIGEGYSMIAAENRINFIDLYRLIPLRNTSDGIHLNNSGHQIVANVITKFLRELERSKASKS